MSLDAKTFSPETIQLSQRLAISLSLDPLGGFCLFMYMCRSDPPVTRSAHALVSGAYV